MITDGPSLFLKSTLLAAACCLAAQSDSAIARTVDDGVGLAPSRFELVMSPGSERTVVVNIIYDGVGPESAPFRLVASPGDWSIREDGEIEYFQPGSLPRSAAPWMLYSPAEVTAMPGRVHPIRVTISVPDEASPGDHLAALFVEARPDNPRATQSENRVVLRFRLAALFYIRVPGLTMEGSLEGLEAHLVEDGMIVVPTIRNSGNSRIRPRQSVRIFNGDGEVVGAAAEHDSLPVLGGRRLAAPIFVQAALTAPGAYRVRYQMDPGEGGAVVQGETTILVSKGERRH